MLYSQWLLPFLAFACGAFITASVFIADLDSYILENKELRYMLLATEDRRIQAMKALSGDPKAIDRINAGACLSEQNNYINKPEPLMNTALTQFNSIGEARAFYARNRRHRDVRAGHLACFISLKARLAQRGSDRFLIGDTALA